MSGECPKCGEHAVDCECESVFDYVGDIVVTHRPIEDTCSIRVVHEDKIRFLYVGASQYLGANVFFNEVFILEDAEAIRDALTTCIDYIKGTKHEHNYNRHVLKGEKDYFIFHHGNKIVVWNRDGTPPNHPGDYIDAFYKYWIFYHQILVTEIWFDNKNGNVGTIKCNFLADHTDYRSSKEILDLLHDEIELVGWYFYIEWTIIRKRQ